MVLYQKILQEAHGLVTLSLAKAGLEQNLTWDSILKNLKLVSSHIFIYRKS